MLVFARHDLYPHFAHFRLLLGISALTDQQLAGGLAKVMAIGVFWTAAGIVLARGGSASQAGDDVEINWDDVERELQRADRRGPHALSP